MNERRSAILRVDRRSRGAAVIVVVDGEVDLASAPLLKAGLAQARQEDPDVLVVDLSEVGFFGSAGLSLLAEASELDPRHALRVVATGGPLRAIQLAAMDQILDVFATVEAALGSSE
ncbi:MULTISPECIES: STAS domain-containing protein [Nocardia]|uniref:STAS domain-containing protein n=1 Tax=Nocardia aurea TaxID=2144174 RepID=A0ABV3G0M1_9NOCA|nr:MULTISPECIES: STAS domain-containing protein [Nocardia]